MKKCLKLFSFGLITLFAFSVSVNAKDVSTWTDLKTCLENTTDEVCKLTTSIPAADEAVSVSGTKTLDLNENTLTMQKSLFVEKDANLTIDGNGKITSSAIDKLIYVKAGATFSADNVEIITTKSSGRAVYIKGDNGTLKTKVTIGKNCKLSANYTLMIAYSDANTTLANGVTVDIYGTLTGLVGNDGWQYGGEAIYVNGNIENAALNSSVINIHDGSVLEGKKSPAIYAAGYAIWNIGSATITGSEALSIKAGKFTVDGATLTANGEFVEPENVIHNGNGTEPTGAAISVTTNSSHDGNIDITLKNVKVVSENGYAFFEKTTYGEDTQIDNLLIESGEFTGKVRSLYISSGLTQFIETGKFNTEPNIAWLADDSLLAKIDGVIHVDVARTLEVEEVKNGKVELKDEELTKAIKGQTIELTITPSEGYYLKNIKLQNANDSEEYLDINTNETFEMPDYDVVIIPEFQKYLDKDENIVTTKPSLEVDSSIESDLVEEIGEVKTDKTLIEAIDVEQIINASSDLVEVKIDAKLEEIKEEDGKVSLVFNIKPVYSVNGEDKGILSNDMLTGDKIKIKLPVPSSIEDTHAKVTHKDSNGKVVSEDEYEVKVDGQEKYIEIETTSFSEFTVEFYTPEDDTDKDTDENNTIKDETNKDDEKDKEADEDTKNPQTLDSLSISIIALIISFTILSITFVVLKNKKVFNK